MGRILGCERFRPAGRYYVKATISVDYRVSDGVEAARFMQALPKEHWDDVAKYLEEPLRLMV